MKNLNETYKEIITENQNSSENFLKDFKKYINDDYEEGNEPSNMEILDMGGELMNKYDISIEDAQYLVNKYPKDIDVQIYVKDLLSDMIMYKSKDDYVDEIVSYVDTDKKTKIKLKNILNKLNLEEQEVLFNIFRAYYNK